MEEIKEKWIVTYRASIISVCAMVLLLGVAVICHLFLWHDAPFQFLAACLGAGVTVIITNLLLVEQTKQQQTLQEKQVEAQRHLQAEEKDQDLVQAKRTEQYKEKLRIYQEFITKLFEVVKDRGLTTDEKISMQFQTAILAIHTEPNHIEAISASVGDVLKCLCSTETKYEVENLQKALFNIVRQFRAELYEEEGNEDEAALEKTLNNFVEAYSSVETIDNMEHIKALEPSNNKEGHPQIWEEARKGWQKVDDDGNQKWMLIIDGETIRLHRPNNLEIHVQFGFWRGHYYIQAKYDKVGSFSQELKWEYKGSKTYELWWNHLYDPEYYNLEEGEFWVNFNQSESMQKTLVAWFDKLIGVIEKQDISVNRKVELMKMIDEKKYEDAGWSFSYRQWDTLVCYYENEEYGNPFIDILNDTSGQIIIRLGNRKNSREFQKKNLQKIGHNENDINTDNRTDYVILDAGTSDESVATHIADLINKLSNN